MVCKSIETLRQEGLPPSMPAATEIGVWKRSTGYEVILPYRLGWLNWLLLGAGLVALVGSIFPLANIFSVTTPMGQAILYTVLVVPVLGYMLFLSFKLSQTRSTKIRIDMTPLNMTFTLVEPSGVSRKFNDVPVNQIENVCLYQKRGIRINGNIAGTHFGVWTGRGLKSDDLYYLMCVIGKATLLSAQTNNPREPVMKEDIGHIELG